MRLVSVMTVILSGASLGLGLISTVLEIQGRNLTVTGYANDKLLHHMITTGDWEPHLYGLAKRLLPLGTETALDIGANLGYLTLHLSEILSKGGHVYAFEPIPSTYSVLEKNVQQNNYTQQTKTFHNAVSDDGLTICVQGFREDPQRKRNMGDVKLPEHHHDQTCTGEAVAVKCVAVDEMVKQQMMKSVDFIKIDVRGED
jgi:FkbM family methyltransferase